MLRLAGDHVTPAMNSGSDCPSVPSARRRRIVRRRPSVVTMLGPAPLQRQSDPQRAGHATASAPSQCSPSSTTPLPHPTCGRVVLVRETTVVLVDVATVRRATKRVDCRGTRSVPVICWHVGSMVARSPTRPPSAGQLDHRARTCHRRPARTDASTGEHCASKETSRPSNVTTMGRAGGSIANDPAHGGSAARDVATIAAVAEIASTHDTARHRTGELYMVRESVVVMTVY